MKTFGILVASIVVAGSLSACSSQAPQNDEFQVVATTTQVTEFTRAVVGDTGTVTGLIQPNQSAHSFDPSAKQLLALSQADAVVINGADLSPGSLMLSPQRTSRVRSSMPLQESNFSLQVKPKKIMLLTRVRKNTFTVKATPTSGLLPSMPR